MAQELVRRAQLRGPPRSGIPTTHPGLFPRVSSSVRFQRTGFLLSAPKHLPEPFRGDESPKSQRDKSTETVFQGYTNLSLGSPVSSSFLGKLSDHPSPGVPGRPGRAYGALAVRPWPWGEVLTPRPPRLQSSGSPH